MKNPESQNEDTNENNRESNEHQIDLNAFEEQVKHANPKTLARIGNALKEKTTWVGMLGITLGAYMVDRTFNHQGEIAQNVVDTLSNNNKTPDPETVREILIALKVCAVSILAASGILTYTGYLKGNDPMRDYRKIRDNTYVHKDAFK